MFNQFTIARFRQARFQHWSMPKFDKLCRNLARAAGSLAIWPGYWPDPAVLAETPAWIRPERPGS
jgi:hypothetical protein